MKLLKITTAAIATNNKWPRNMIVILQATANAGIVQLSVYVYWLCTIGFMI